MMKIIIIMILLPVFCYWWLQNKKYKALILNLKLRESDNNFSFDKWSKWINSTIKYASSRKIIQSMVNNPIWIHNNLWREVIIIIIIMFISSNYLIVSGEHSVHFNTNVCSRFCCTTHPFQAFGYPLLLLYMGGFGFHPSLSTGVRATAAVYFKAISPMTQLHRFLVSWREVIQTRKWMGI